MDGGDEYPGIASSVLKREPLLALGTIKCDNVDEHGDNMAGPFLLSIKEQGTTVVTEPFDKTSGYHLGNPEKRIQWHKQKESFFLAPIPR